MKAAARGDADATACGGVTMEDDGEGRSAGLEDEDGSASALGGSLAAAPRARGAACGGGGASEWRRPLYGLGRRARHGRPGGSGNESRERRGRARAAAVAAAGPGRDRVWRRGVNQVTRLGRGRGVAC